MSKDTGSGDQEKRYTEAELEYVNERHQFQAMEKRTRQHMLDRMKKDLIALTLKINDLTESLRSKTNIYNDESNKQMQTRQDKLQSRYKLDQLMIMIEREQMKRQERISSLQTSIQNKQDALQKRLTRSKRQAEIAETAANESKDQTEIEYRESLFVNRAWAAFFRRRMAKEHKHYEHIERAFQRIKNETGCSDVREIV